LSCHTQPNPCYAAQGNSSHTHFPIAGKWDKVEEKVKEMATKNEVTEGLLEAAVHLITVCQQMGEASQVTEVSQPMQPTRAR
jgi:hypothetical protein